MTHDTHSYFRSFSLCANTFNKKNVKHTTKVNKTQHIVAYNLVRYIHILYKPERFYVVHFRMIYEKVTF